MPRPAAESLPMPFEYKPPSRLSLVLRSGPLYWGALAIVALAFGVYAAFHL